MRRITIRGTARKSCEDSQEIHGRREGPISISHPCLHSESDSRLRERFMQALC